jgi:hypothetical protein
MNSNRGAGRWHTKRPWLPVALCIGLGAWIGLPNSAVSDHVNPNQDHRHAKSPPLDAEDFWERLMRLLNERQGSITKEGFQSAFGVKFGTGTLSQEGHVTTYWLRAGKEGYFEARLTIYDEKFKSDLGPSLNGAHLNWYVGWDIDAFGDSAKGECVRADYARSSLMSAGWTSPWLKWGIWEEILTAQDAAGTTKESSTQKLPSEAKFFRQVDEDSGHRDRLPRGVIDSAGDFRDSCVTGIVVDAGLGVPSFLVQ